MRKLVEKYINENYQFLYSYNETVPVEPPSLINFTDEELLRKVFEINKEQLIRVLQET